MMVKCAVALNAREHEAKQSDQKGHATENNNTAEISITHVGKNGGEGSRVKKQ